MDRPTPGPPARGRSATPATPAAGAPARRRVRPLLPLAAASACALGLPAGAGASAVSGSYGVLGVRTVHATATTTGLPAGARVVLEGRRGAGAATRVRDDAVLRGGVARLSWRYPPGGGALHLRVRAVRGRGRAARTIAVAPWRTLRTGALRRGRPLAPVTIADVVSAPAPGAAGDLVLRGRPRIAVGDAVALTAGAATPGGLLVRVRGVRRATGGTVARVVPTTLPEVVSVGDLSLAAAAEDPELLRAASKVAVLTRTLACGGYPATIAGRASLSAGLRLRTAWRASTSLERANVTAELSTDVRATLDAGITTAGGTQCALRPQPMYAAPVRLRSVVTSIGPLPVTLTVDGQVQLSGSISSAGPMATAARGGTRATARFSYDGFRPRVRGRLSTRLRPHDTRIAASGGAQAGITPTIDVRILGLAGPRLDLGAGLRTTADIGRPASQPWWTTTVPDELGGVFALQALREDLEAPRERLDGHDAPLARASGAAGGSSVTGAGPSPEPLPAGVRARVRWDSPGADLDLHAWDAAGRHLSPAARGAIPGVALAFPGGDLGGEELRDEDPGRPLTVGACLAAGTEAGVSVDLREPDGRTLRRTYVLRGSGGAVLVGAVPSGAVGFVPAPGWCAAGDPAAPGQVSTGALPEPRPRSAARPGSAFSGEVRQTGRVTFGTQER